MKNFKSGTTLFLLALSLFMYSCGSGESNHTHDADGEHVEAATDMTGKEYTSAYVCAKHCKGSGSHEAGKCPGCGMDYVMNENHKADGHGHDQDETPNTEDGNEQDNDEGTSTDEEGHEGHDH